MAGLLPGESSHHGTSEGGPSSINSQEKPEEVSRWYLSRREIEESSPSRRDGIDLKKETYLRKSYCTFLQDLGMRLKVPQVTIATAIIFCHRFFIRQSHAKNDRRTIATVCMFLAGKVEETPRPLKDVIIVSYEIIHKKDSTAPQRIRQQKEVYEQQKELILLGERVVLATLGYDLNVHHPYKPLVEAIKKFQVAQNALAQVAWNFVNDGLRTSLCLQFKPHHIAAGAIFLAAKFLKVKLPSDGEKVWWQEFDVTPRQLEEVSNQMLELYEQNRVPQSQGSEVEGSAGGGSSHRAPAKALVFSEEQALKQVSSRTATEQSHLDSHGVPPRTSQNNHSIDDRSGETGSVITDHKVDSESKDDQHPELLPHKENMKEVQNKSKLMERIGEDQGRNGGRNDIAEAGEWRGDGASHKSSSIVGRNLDIREGPVGQSQHYSSLCSTTPTLALSSLCLIFCLFLGIYSDLMDGVERKVLVQTQKKVSILDMVLRVLALFLTLAATIVLGTDKQTKIVPVKIIATLPPVNVPATAKWHHLSAFTYHVVTNVIACAYATISLLLVLANKGGKCRGGRVMVIIVLDLTMVALLSSSIGAAGGIGLIGYEGNSHVQWKKVCGVFSKFCDRVAVSLILSLLGSLAFFLLVAFGALRLKKLN